MIHLYKKIFKESSNSLFNSSRSKEPALRDGVIISVSTIFDKGCSYPKSIETWLADKFKFEFKSNKDEWIKYVEELPTKKIPFHRIVPTQKTIDLRKIEAGKFQNEKPKPYFVKFNDLYYLIDGHHRITQMVRNNQAIKGKVIELEKTSY